MAVYEIEAVRRAVAVLRAMAANGGDVGLAELSRTLDMDKSRVFRLLHTLTVEGLVSQDPDTKRFRLGADLAVLGHAAVDSFDLRREARPVMARLTESLGFPTYLNVAGSTDVVCIEHVASLSSIDLYGRAGRTMPYYACPSGYVLLAWGPEDRRTRVMGGMMPRLAAKTPLKPKHLARILDETRANGFAFGDADLEDGVSSMAAPIFSFQGDVIASLGIAGFSLTFDVGREELSTELVAAAQEVSRRGGATPLM